MWLKAKESRPTQGEGEQARSTQAKRLQAPFQANPSLIVRCKLEPSFNDIHR